MRKSLKGESGNDIALDYRQIPVFSPYAPMDFLEKPWAIIAEIDTHRLISMGANWSWQAK